MTTSDDLDIHQLLCDHQPGHSAFQIAHFIVTRGNWTPWGKYRQCLRELDRRRAGIEQLEHELEIAALDLADLARRWSFRATTRRRRALERRQLTRKMRDLRLQLRDVRRELNVFLAIARSLKATLGELTQEQRAALEEETWRTKLRGMAALDLATQGRISEPTLSLLLATPHDWHAPLLRQIRRALDARGTNEGVDQESLGWLDALQAVPAGAA